MDAPSQLHTENEVRRTEVINSIRNENLVVVVGTGVSIESLDSAGGVPEVVEWQGLLRNGLARCYNQEMISAKVRKLVSAEISEGSVEFLISAAQKITGWIVKQEGSTSHWLKGTIGELKVSKPGLIEAIIRLGGILSTINYDDLLAQVANRKVYDWRKLSEVNELIRNKKFNEFILHLHGHWNEPESVILDWKSYYAVLNDPNTQQHLKNFTLSRTLLFIGCGNTFMDPNLQAWLEWAKSAMSHERHRHYILCRTGEQPNFYKQLVGHGYLAPLVYGETYGELEPFLIKLAHDAAAAKVTAVSVVDSATAASVVLGSVGIPSRASRLSDQWPRQSIQ
jgi:SIR2-like domain